ncbi:MAG: hypothetical protein Q9N62_00825 [Ghiorsea sp.]|nr:hypothetical protein [Ghiorsea sp.]
MKDFSDTLSMLKEIWAELIFKIAGNLFPLYIGAVILLIVHPEDVANVFNPQSLIVYSSTFLFSAMYLWYKTIDRKDNHGLLSLLVFIILVILVSLFYAFSVTKQMDMSFNFEVFSPVLFILSLMIFVWYEAKHHQQVTKTSFSKETQQSYESLESRFDEC